jgi:hypothetical protein
LVSDELKGVWKEAVVAYQKYHPGNFIKTGEHYKILSIPGVLTRIRVGYIPIQKENNFIHTPACLASKN